VPFLNELGYIDGGRTSCWNSTILVVKLADSTRRSSNVLSRVTYLGMLELGSGVCGDETEARTREPATSASEVRDAAPTAPIAINSFLLVKPPSRPVPSVFMHLPSRAEGSRDGRVDKVLAAPLKRWLRI
jgi:hypothetical protein